MAFLRKIGLIIVVGAGIGLFFFGILKLNFIDRLSIKVFSYELKLIGYSSLGYITIANFLGGFSFVWQGFVFWKESYKKSHFTIFTIVFSMMYSFWLVILGIIHVTQLQKSFSLLKMTVLLSGHPVWLVLTLIVVIYVIIGLVPLLMSVNHYGKRS